MPSILPGLRLLPVDRYYTHLWGAVYAGEPNMRIRNGHLASLNQPEHVGGIIQQGISIYFSGVIEAWTILRPLPAHEGVPAVIVCFDDAVIATSQQVF